jgi:multiple sugar transport system substrate-binding protein
MKKIMCLSVVLAAFGGAVFANGAKASSSQAVSNAIRWAYWGSESRVKISQQAIDIYQQANPGVVINPEVSGGAGDHFAKVDTQIAGGNGPDIIQMGGNIPDYVNKGVLADLTPYSGAGKAIDTSTIDAGAVANGIINGKLYGISTGVSMPALVYNKSLIQKAGLPLPSVSMTYDEFRAYLVTHGKPLFAKGITVLPAKAKSPPQKPPKRIRASTSRAAACP